MKHLPNTYSKLSNLTLGRNGLRELQNNGSDLAQGSDAIWLFSLKQY